MIAVEMDALARLEPVARPLLAEVDRALATLGAPAGHPVWAALRRVRATPGDAVAFLATTDPERLRATAAALREQARLYARASVAAPVGWHGPAAAAFGGHATALATHQSAGPDSMAGRLTATASYVEAAADWYELARSAVARALAEVLTSGQAIAVRTSADGTLAASVLAAADIATHLLEAVGDAVAVGEESVRAWQGRLDELPFGQPPGLGAVAGDTVVDLRP